MRKASRFAIYAVLSLILILVIILFVLIFGRMDNTVEASGTVLPVNYVNVAPGIGGIIEDFLVQEGDQIQIGDTIFLLVSDELKFEVERTKLALVEDSAGLVAFQEEYDNLTSSKSFETSVTLASLSEAEKRKQFARTEYERIKAIYEANGVTEQEKKEAELYYELMKSNYQVLENRLMMLKREYERQIKEVERSMKLAEQAYDLAQQKLKKTVVVSPISGTVLSTNTDELIGIMANKGQPLVRIANLSQMIFSARVNEGDISKIQIGQKTRIYINAFPHRQYKIFKGRVTEISPAPQVVQTAISFEVKVEIDEPWVEVSTSRLCLKPGMTGRAEIVIEADVKLLEIIFESITK